MLFILDLTGAVSDVNDSHTGLPSSLPDQQFEANMRAVIKSNDATKHPAQAPTTREHQYYEVTSEASAGTTGPIPSSPQYPVLQPDVSLSLSSYQPQSQEVTQHCPMPGCVWASYKTHDKTLLETCFKQLSLHLLTIHDVSDSSSGDTPTNTIRGDKSTREYQAATKQRQVTNLVDDATYNLCEARFFPTPLDIKVLGLKMPTAISPVNTVVDLSHLGVDVTNPETLRKIHNRATVTFRLRDFCDPNLRTYHASGDEMVAISHSNDRLSLSKTLKNLDSSVECVGAFFNYCTLARNFHVLDWSPQALMKVVLEKYFIGPPTVDQYNRLFEKFIHENAVRATRKAVPLTYQEILNIWTSHITAAPINSATIESMVNKIMLNKSKRDPSIRGVNSSEGHPSPNKRPRLTKEDYCPTFNVNKTPPYCTNQAASGGCLSADGKLLKHACSKRMGPRRFCNSDRHNIFSH